MSLGFLLVGPISGVLSDRVGYRGLTTAGVILSSVVLVFLSVLPQNAPPLEVSGVLALAGIGGGLFGSPNISSVMGSMSANERGVGAATNSTMLNVASMMALTIAFVFIGTTVKISNFITLFVGTVRNLPASVVQSAAYQAQWRTFMGSFHSVFAIFSVVVILALFPSILRPKGTSPNLAIETSYDVSGKAEDS